MRWHKRDMWRVGIALAGLLLFLVLMVWIPVLTASTSVHASGFAISRSVQTTPTVDATVAALNKEKLAQEVQQLKDQNTPDFFGWLRTNAAILLSTLVVVIGGLIGLFRWFGDRRDTQGKDLRAQAEERFKTAVTALGSDNEATQVGGAILLRSFLNEEDEAIYGHYYIQIFDLAVAYLRLPYKFRVIEDPSGLPPSKIDINVFLPLRPLRDALTAVFKEVYPLARERSFQMYGHDIEEVYAPQFLNASHIRMDGAFLVASDFHNIWMPEASLVKASLAGSDLSHSYLCDTNFSLAMLGMANLSESYIAGANFTGAFLMRTNLSGVRLDHSNLRGADLSEVQNLEKVQSLKDTDLRGVIGLTKEQLLACKANGAIIDEELTASPPQSPATPAPISQSNDAQAPSASPVQVSTPPASTGGSGNTSAQSSTEP